MGTTAVAFMEKLKNRQMKRVVTAQVSLGHQQARQALPAAIENPRT